jgi:NADPH:quinone reductase-like Zn-dependent oxidoreductase
MLPSPLLTGRGLTVRGFSLRPAEKVHDGRARRHLYDRLAAIAAEPAMMPVVAATYPLEALPEALAHAARPGIEGRVMLALDA